MFKLNTNILINSNEDILVFTLAENGDILYTAVDSSFNILESNNLVEGKALKYSIIIDKEDNFHLLALLINGDLTYYKYVDNQWSQTIIGSFDVKSNYYNQIEIIMIKDQIHIIYNYSNLINPNLWTIQHVIYDNKERHNVIQYITSKAPDPFVIDVNSQGTIHLLYSSILNHKSQIYYTFYNPFTNIWSSKTKLISSDKSNNHYPFLLIDSRDNVHSLWLEESKNRYTLKYFKMNSTGKEKFIWREIKPSIDSVRCLTPIIYEENNILKLQFGSQDEIKTLFSQDFGESWSIAENHQILKDTVFIQINSNLEPHLNRVKYGFCNLSSQVEFYFLNSYFHKQYNNEIKEFKDNSQIEPPNGKNLIDEAHVLYELNTRIDSMVNDQTSFQSQLNHVLDKQRILEEKLYKLENTIQEKKTSFFEKLFK